MPADIDHLLAVRLMVPNNGEKVATFVNSNLKEKCSVDLSVTNFVKWTFKYRFEKIMFSDLFLNTTHILPQMNKNNQEKLLLFFYIARNTKLTNFKD